MLKQQRKMVRCGGSKCCKILFFNNINMLRVQFVLFMTKTLKFQIDIVNYFKAVRSCSVRGKENALK